MRLVKKKLAPDFWIFYFCDDVDILSCYYLKYKDTFSCPFTTIFFCERLFDLKKKLPEGTKSNIIKEFFVQDKDQLVELGHFSREEVYIIQSTEWK